MTAAALSIPYSVEWVALPDMNLDLLIERIKQEHPSIGDPVMPTPRERTASWFLPTGWIFLARESRGRISVAFSRGERPAAWIPVTSENEALCSLGWLLRKRSTRTYRHALTNETTVAAPFLSVASASSAGFSSVKKPPFHMSPISPRCPCFDEPLPTPNVMITASP